MRLAAHIVFDLDVVAQLVDEPRLPILAVVFGVVDGDDVLELVRAGPADPLHRVQLVGVRRAGGVEERPLVEAGTSPPPACRLRNGRPNGR